MVKYKVELYIYRWRIDDILCVCILTECAFVYYQLLRYVIYYTLTEKKYEKLYVTWEKFGFIIHMVSLPENIGIFHIFFLSVYILNDS